MSETSQFHEGVLKRLQDTTRLFDERNRVYKDNFRKVGAIMKTLFPEGPPVLSQKDFEKWHLWELFIVKLTRYANNYQEGHADSLQDMMVYLAMIAELDSEHGTPSFTINVEKATTDEPGFTPAQNTMVEKALRRETQRRAAAQA